MNHKTIDAVMDFYWNKSVNGLPLFEGEPEDIAQAAINSLWTDFDAEDESTWPEYDKECVLVLKCGAFLSGCRRQMGDEDFWCAPSACWISGKNISEWAYPAELRKDG